MSIEPNPARSLVTAAFTIVMVFGGLLGARAIVRWANADVPAPPAATHVEKPSVNDAAVLEVPCWSCPSARSWPVRFHTDLDLIAPLGDGPGNAAEFFAAFEKNRGPRDAEARAFRERQTQRDDDLGTVVAGDDPLLLEAEPWVDQATMRFYPEIFRMEGAETRIPNLLVPLTMARSWTARGVDAADPQVGLEDCRRAIRLGRLLRQDDVVIINDLVGLACIHIGTRGVYRIAQRERDSELALLASVVIGEVAPQRMMTAQRITAVDLAPYLRREQSGTHRLEMPDSHLDAIMDMAESLSERRFYGEVILTGNVILRFGTPDQRERVLKLLQDLATDEDPIIADFATWALDNPPTEDQLAEFYPHPMER